jgi:hypothetical protein
LVEVVEVRVERTQKMVSPVDMTGRTQKLVSSREVVKEAEAVQEVWFKEVRREAVDVVARGKSKGGSNARRRHRGREGDMV